ncbi:wd-40 repeat protein [Stylonychia lemnae]|uniref:Wd-40 repeat protein n=1 Tax=Stylonychia lemnae TaxID=5949 RepID=A0A078ACG1_STYLE|nr:wd-40 repeat protein [Stylonychia lemnae]|eukprot:CDW79546.1 wd-40 repeat protein [Stylonychia lemnae]
MSLVQEQTLLQSLLQTVEQQIPVDKNLTPYQWVIDKFKEEDYHEYDSYQSREIIEFEQNIGKMHCTSFFFKKNQFMIVYDFESTDGRKTKFEFRDIDSGKLDRVYIHTIKAISFVSHQVFNEIDYICIQQDQNLYIYDIRYLENLEQYSVKIELQQKFSFKQVQILDEFYLLFVGLAQRMNSILLLVRLKDSIKSYPANKQDVFIEFDEETFSKFQESIPPNTGGLVKMLQPGFNNQICFNFQKRNYVFDYQTTSLVKDFESTKIIAIQHEDQKYAIDFLLNIYKFDQEYEFTKIRKLYENEDRSFQLSSADFTRDRLIVKLKQDRQSKYIIIVHSSKYLNAVKTVKRDSSILGRPQEFLQIVNNFPQTEVFELLPTDTILFKDFDGIYLNGDRFIKVQNIFKDEKSHDNIDSNNCCIMSDRINGPIYILWVPHDTKIVYLNKNTQEITSLILPHYLSFSKRLFRAWIDFDLNLLIINSASSSKVCIILNLATLLEDDTLQYHCAHGPHFSIYFEENFLQVSNTHQINFMFYKDKQICKTIIYNFDQNEKYECRDGYREDFKSYNQPLTQSLYFQYASKIEIDSNQIHFYMRKEVKPVGYFNTVIFHQDIVKYQKFSKSTIEEVLDSVKDVRGYINHISGFGNCFNIFENNFIALESILKQLGFQDKESLPILIAPPMYGNKTPLDIAILNRQQKIINLMMSTLTKYQDHILFNEIVDKNICNLIKEQIDLQEYFESSMPIYQIFDSKFPTQHSDESELILGISLENPKDIHDQYDKLFEGKLENGSGANVSIEYFLINLPETIKGQSTDFMKTLNETTKLEYFEHETIQHIINFKWDTYTKSFYKFKFYIYILFLASFIFETLYQTYFGMLQYQSEEKAKIQDTRQDWAIIVSKSISSIVLLYFIGYEMAQIRNQKFEYFKETWNMFDFSHFLSYIVLSIFEFQDIDKEILIITYIVVITLSFMKLFFFLRVYDAFSFLVSMIAGNFNRGFLC